MIGGCRRTKPLSVAESYCRPDSECGKCEREETETAGRFPAEWIEEVKQGGI